MLRAGVAPQGRAQQQLEDRVLDQGSTQTTKHPLAKQADWLLWHSGDHPPVAAIVGMPRCMIPQPFTPLKPYTLRQKNYANPNSLTA